MGLFSRTVTDQEWLDMVKPSYEAALPLTTSLNMAIDTGSIEDQVRIIGEILVKLPMITAVVKKSPNPTSSEARRAKGSLERALKDYMDGAKQGSTFLRDLAGGLADRAGSGGLSGRAATGRAVFQKTVFEKLVTNGRCEMEKATTFFSQV